ncbi:MAG: PEP-CTERM sorting domain-containing protein [Phycisphaerales bacterium]|nr:MAG: PEP-CTERM sorting domain-containing protein [Phycisphaerales bacterium]
MKSLTQRVMWFALIALLMPLGAQSAFGDLVGDDSGDLIGVDNDTGDLYAVSTADASLSYIGSTGLDKLGSLEYWNGSLYGMTNGSKFAIDPNDRPALYRFDLNASQTAVTAVVKIGTDSGLGLSTFEGGLAFGPDGTAYGVNEGSTGDATLFSVDLGTGAGTPIGIVSNVPHDINGLSWRSDGMLIGLDRESQSLLVIDPVTLGISVLAPVSEAIGGIGGMVLAGEVGYFATAGPGQTVPGSNALYSFDPYTGDYGYVGNFNLPPDGSLEGISGLAVIPEPASLALLAFGGMALLRRRRK